ncbi:hypothetical protein Vafri_5481 [Volvox africanus]|uniref:Peptidase M43 pregnancy-associated plasma-A domain-containing protein n=1 Tax=Volvox africanus TaxID=51714 RepID=A0A8J4AVY6_9CHLO|nr:hypothetical protein Vafri_5481 [Volvox africanus]
MTLCFMMARQHLLNLFLVLSLYWVTSSLVDARADPKPIVSSASGSGAAVKAKIPFLALDDQLAAHSNEIEKIYQQVSISSAVAFHLFGAAKPLPRASGSSDDFLSCLTPKVIRLYVSLPERANSSVVRELYDLSWELYGSSSILQACFYDLYKSIGETFTWVRDNIPLRLQEVPGQPKASAMWPNIGSLELTAAVASALSSSGPLHDTAILLSSSCGLTATAFAALVPNISSVLKELHKDLPVLQSVVKKLRDFNYVPGMSVASNSAGGETPRPKAVPNRRQMQQQQSYNRIYFLPPSNFTPAPPASLPDVLIPLVFHIMLYKNPDGSIGPDESNQAATLLDGMMKQVNMMAKPSKIQFFIREVRNNPIKYPYLLFDNREIWKDAPFCKKKKCLISSSFMEPVVADWPRSINLFVTSDTTGGNSILGYSMAPGSDFHPERGFVFISWDNVASKGFNSPGSYYDGSNTILHEIFHFLGLLHSFGSSMTDTCNDDDYVIDTPVVLGPMYSTSSIYSTLISYCLDIFGSEYGGSWNRVYEAASTRQGIPEADMNAWADSCPKKPGYDELGNYMTYTPAVCLDTIGHLTPGQVQRAHYITAEINPILYAWGQYYATMVAPPSPQPSPPPDPSLSICKVSAGSCPCKSKWSFNGTQYSFCSRIDSTSDQLWCEVQNAATCSSCAKSSDQQAASSCVMPCDAGATPSVCNLGSSANSKVPPPFPPSPPPYPPPPPPRAVREDCKVALSGCACRSTWLYDNAYTYASYCSNPDGRKVLWCLVSPTCPTFATMPYQYCASNLTASYCGTGEQVYFSTVRIPSPPPSDVPMPPPPRPRLPPKPPSPRPPPPKKK